MPMRHRILYMTVLIMSGLVVSCHAGHDTHHQEGDSQETQVTFTSYSQDYEVFCESAPLIAGQQVRMLLHVTRLSDFKPLAQGRLSLTLTIVGQRQQMVADTLHHPGVAIVDFLPLHNKLDEWIKESYDKLKKEQ